MALTGRLADFHDRSMQDPAYAREYAIETVRVRAIDDLVNSLDEAREEAGVTKAELARTIGADPSVVRRLLTSSQRNPSLGTVAEIAAALGLKISLVPMGEDEQRELAELRKNVEHAVA